jgi:uncharacterized membrane protein YtjA (UPF0391 family)
MLKNNKVIKITFGLGIFLFLLSFLWTNLKPFGILPLVSPATDFGKFILLTSPAYASLFFKVGIALLLVSGVLYLYKKP